MLLNFRKLMGLLTSMESFTFLFLFFFVYKFIFFISSFDIELIENGVS